MIIQPYDYVLIGWCFLAALSTLYVAVDQFKNNPEPTVMRWGFILVTLYMGPLGLLLYVLADKEPRPGVHEVFTSPLWKQGIGSTIHCVAGDATGIILAAVITASLGLPMWLDLIVEYLAGFSFGLFIFESLFMKSMMGGTYWENVRKSFLPEFISMNFMMAGMAPVMSFLMMGRDMRAMDPTELMFWGVMSLGVIAGFATAYPSNVWMVARGLKHGLMTVRPKGSRFDVKPKNEQKNDKKEKEAGHAGHEGHAGHAGHGRHGMMTDATTPQIAALGGVSLLALLLGMAAPANWVNLNLSAHEVGGLIMPRGMTMDRDTPAGAMRDMSFADPRKVTASYGLRYEYYSPLKEQNDKVLFFDVPTGKLIPNYTGDWYTMKKTNFAPRLGLTWAPERFSNRTVFRIGGGIYYGPGLECGGLGYIVGCVTAYSRLSALYRQFQKIW